MDRRTETELRGAEAAKLRKLPNTKLPKKFVKMPVMVKRLAPKGLLLFLVRLPPTILPVLAIKSSVKNVRLRIMGLENLAAENTKNVKKTLIVLAKKKTEIMLQVVRAVGR